jgi:pyrimidine operon attenuation protein/uracil phosphoribosyltransferase
MTRWPGPPLRTLEQDAFETACTDLMRIVEQDFQPSLVVGIRTGGWIVAQAMARGSARVIPVLPLTCRRNSTGLKSRVPMLRHVLTALPRPVLDLLRRVEHRTVSASRGRRMPVQATDNAEAEAISRHVAALAPPGRVLVADDAVDSGVTLRTVLHVLSVICRPGTEFRSAAITQTLDNPVVAPDYVLFRGTLCRFPWSFDAAA